MCVRNEMTKINKESSIAAKNLTDLNFKNVFQFLGILAEGKLYSGPVFST